MINKIIASIEILPKGKEGKAEEAYKKALSVVEQSGLYFVKESFGVALEGHYEQIMRLVEAIQLSSFNAGAEEIIVNVKIRSKNGTDLKLTHLR